MLWVSCYNKQLVIVFMQLLVFQHTYKYYCRTDFNCKCLFVCFSVHNYYNRKVQYFYIYAYAHAQTLKSPQTVAHTVAREIYLPDVRFHIMMSLGEFSPGDRFCVSRKGGTWGGGWVHPQGANGVSQAWISCRKPLLGA